MSVEKIGDIDVDAGCVMIGDPCYTMFKGTSDEKNHDAWIGFCDELDNAGQDRNGHCETKYGTVVVSSGYGDGSYPVFAVKNSDGRVVGAFVQFGEIDYYDWAKLRDTVLSYGDDFDCVECEDMGCEECS